MTSSSDVCPAFPSTSTAVMIPAFGSFLFLAVVCLCGWQLRKPAAGPRLGVGAGGSDAGTPRYSGLAAATAGARAASLPELFVPLDSRARLDRTPRRLRANARGSLIPAETL